MKKLLSFSLLSLSVVLNLASANTTNTPKPEKCPSPSAIHQAGLTMIVGKPGERLFFAMTPNEMFFKFDTSNRWLVSIEADSEQEAWRNLDSITTQPIPQPRPYNWGCYYDHNVSTITVKELLAK